MRILIASTSFPVEPGSNSGVFVKRLADSLDEYCEVVVIAPGGLKKSVDSEFDYKVHSFRYAPKSLQVIAQQPGGLPVALKNNPLNVMLVPLFLIGFLFSLWRLSRGRDILFANWSLSGVLAGYVGKFRKIPVCTTLRGEDVTGIRVSRLRRTLVKGVLKLNDTVVCVSNAAHLELKDCFPEWAHKISHIPNGVGDDFFLATPCKVLDKSLKLVSVGSLIQRKDVATILRALAKTDNSVCLDIIGNGPDYASLLKTSEALGLESRVRFLGEIPSNKIAQTMSAYDALVLASTSEGRPNVVLEAMAASLCVVSSRLPGTEEIIDHEVSGLLFEIGDSDELSRLISTLLVDRDKPGRIGKRARQQLIQHRMTWRDCGRRYYELFCTVTREG